MFFGEKRFVFKHQTSAPREGFQPKEEPRKELFSDDPEKIRKTVADLAFFHHEEVEGEGKIFIWNETLKRLENNLRDNYGLKVNLASFTPSSSDLDKACDEIADEVIRQIFQGANDTARVERVIDSAAKALEAMKQRTLSGKFAALYNNTKVWFETVVIPGLEAFQSDAGKLETHAQLEEGRRIDALFQQHMREGFVKAGLIMPPDNISLIGGAPVEQSAERYLTQIWRGLLEKQKKHEGLALKYRYVHGEINSHIQRWTESGQSNDWDKFVAYLRTQNIRTKDLEPVGYGDLRSPEAIASYFTRKVLERREGFTPDDTKEAEVAFLTIP